MNFLKWLYNIIATWFSTPGILPVVVPTNNNPIPAPTPVPGGYSILINYDRPEPENQVWLLFTAANTVTITGGLVQNVAMTVASLRLINPSMIISFGDTKGGRLYAGITQFADPAPLPTGDQYYGWVEFTRLSTDPCVWTNLSNVDVLGLPLTLSGTDDTGSAFSLGYNKGVSTIQQSIIAHIGLTAAAVVSCTGVSGPGNTFYGPYTKVVGPNNVSSPYPTYQNYLASLCNSSAALVIGSDVPGGTYSGPEKFTGSFLPNPGATGNVLFLTGDFGDTIAITADQFTDQYIYGCGGGNLVWNGNTVPQNDVPDSGPPSATQILHDSVFRKLCVGFNEGYFSTTDTNYSSNFPYFFPFITYKGNIYADAIHKESNSYGFPYSDSNLKVQALANKTSQITFSIIGDTAIQDYTPVGGPNILDGGEYQFGIGSSSQLGTITFGNCRYEASAADGYGGFLPTSSEWFQMFFNGNPDQYIWIQTPGSGTGAVESGNAFNPAPQWQSTGAPGLNSNKLTWGSSVTWVPGATAPSKPTSSKKKKKK